jgi:hypothetical protein
MGIYFERSSAMQAGSLLRHSFRVGLAQEAQAGDSESGKAVSAYGGCSWRMSSRGMREQERTFRCYDMQAVRWDEDGRLGELEDDALELRRCVRKYREEDE